MANGIRLNADFNKHVVIRPDDYQWVPSPMPGVERMMLDRIGDEVARATTIVRYAPNSCFSAHVHSGGEEYLVLAGVFSDEHGDYAQGSYVRNPIGTSHTPHIGGQGATILVKLHQFDTGDTEQKLIDTTALPWLPGPSDGLQVMPLHEYKTEHIMLLKSAPHSALTVSEHTGGVEIYVISGVLYDDEGNYPQGAWLRSMQLSGHIFHAGPSGAHVYLKTGHLQKH